MNDYMNAYINRKRNIDSKLRLFAKECINAGYDVYVSNVCELITSLYIFNGDLRCIVGFRELSYRWICGIDISTEGIGLGNPDTYEFLFTIDDVKSKFNPIPKTVHYNSTRESYLKFYDYLKPFNNED